MPRRRPWNWFSNQDAPSSSAETPRPAPQEEEEASSLPTPKLSAQRRNNGYEDLTQHHQYERPLQQEKGSTGENRGEFGDGGEGADDMSELGLNEDDWKASTMQAMGIATDRREEVQTQPGVEEDVEGPMDMFPQRRRQEMEPRHECEVGHEGGREMGLRRWRGERERDCCTPGERRRVEEWIAGCERAGCVGFKDIRGARDMEDRFEHEDTEDEGVVHVRGGSGGGWAEWGAGWGADSL